MITITDAISSGVFYLQKQQQADGSFLSLSSPSLTSFGEALTLHSIFPTSLILSCINSLEETATLKTIKQKAASFLLTQKSKHWSFNYWTRGSKEAKEMPYPDDLDDTFCALSALHQYDQALIDGRVLADIVKLLTTLETKEGGPYRTWLVPEPADKAWKDIDLAVNSNIAYFLSFQEIDLSNVNQFIESHIEKDMLCSPYYPTIYPLIYFISRSYKGKKKKELKDILFSQKDDKDSWGNPLNTALSVCALLNFKAPPNVVEKSISHLIRTKGKKLWKAYGFCLDPAKKRKTYYSGSSALTTAFCLEALEKYLKAITPKTNKTNKQTDSKSEEIHSQVIKQVKQRFSYVTTELGDQANETLTKVLQGDSKKQITLLPYFFTTALGKTKAVIPEEILIRLGTANMYGWMAYTIYDNFWDEEGDPRTLSIANIALRELAKVFYCILPNNSQFYELFDTIMDDIERSNTWEANYCRIKINNKSIDLQNIKLPHFGNYEILAQKSLGHGLGPLAILFFLGYKKDSVQVKNLLCFFKHYLIARQLNDDAHDWEEDFKMGHLNPVSVMIFQKFNMKDRKDNKQLLSTIMPQLQELFWYEAVVDVCHVIQNHARLARKYLNTLSIVVYPHVFEELLASLDQSAKKALDEHRNTTAFIDSY